MRILTAFFALVLLALAATTKVRAYNLTAFTGQATLGAYPGADTCEMAADETFGICRAYDENGDIAIVKFTTEPTTITATTTTVENGLTFAIYNGAATKKIIIHDGTDLKVYDSDLANPSSAITTSGGINDRSAIVVDSASGKAYITDDLTSNVGDGTDGPKVYTFGGLAGTPDTTTTSATITATGAITSRSLIFVGSDLFVQVTNYNDDNRPGVARLTTGSSLTYDTTAFATTGEGYYGRALAASSSVVYMSDESQNKIHRWAVSPFAYTDAVSVTGAQSAQLMWSPDDLALILCSTRFDTLTMVDPSDDLAVVGNSPTIADGAACNAIMTLSKSQKKIAVFASTSTYDAYFFDYTSPTTTTTSTTTTTTTTTSTTTETATTSLAPATTTTPSPNGVGHVSASAVAALSFLVSAFLAVM